MIAEGKAVVPIGEFQQPQDVAAAAAFLASDDARYIHRSEIIVDGGIINCDTYYMVVKPRVSE